MDQSSTFARHFGRLVWLLMNESASVDEQKMSLRALVTVSRIGIVTLVGDNWQLTANDAPVPSALTGIQDLTTQMAAHSVRSVRIGEGSGPADLLGLARIIASAASLNDGGEQVTQKLAALAPKFISITTVPADPSRQTMSVPAATDAPAPALSSEPPTVPTPLPADAAANGATPKAEAAPAAQPARPSAPQVLATVSDAAKSILAQLAGPIVSTLTPAELLDLLDAANTAEASTKVLDDLVTLAEHSARLGKSSVVLEIVHGVVKRGAKHPEGEIKAAFVMPMRRFSKPAILRAVAGLIVKYPERRQHCYEVLERTGEDGADALVEQVQQARSTEERNSFLEVLTELPATVPALTRMLGDSRWFVARNAADLLGEIHATAAEGELIQLLRHLDDRVRRSAANALLKLGTPGAVKGVYDAVGDSSADVRMQVASALSTRKDGKTSATLIRAIENESDAEVQAAIISALGKIATPEAVAKLVKMSEPEGRLFRKKDVTLRVAAIVALGDAQTPVAIAALKELVGDKEREVRDAATRVLTQAR